MTEASRTTVTELATALGMLAPSLEVALAERPDPLRFVGDETWSSLESSYASGEHSAEFDAAFSNGRAMFAAADGLRMRPPRLVEWKGPHRPPGDDVTPADLRVDHVYQISCKYHSRVMQNAGPPRLFDHLLATEGRTRLDWFLEVAPIEYQAYYEAARVWSQLTLPEAVRNVTTADRAALRETLRPRRLPTDLRAAWTALATQVGMASAERWAQSLRRRDAQLRMLWRLLRIGDAPYFLLGARGHSVVRLRVASRWDWVQRYTLEGLAVRARPAGQPEVEWRALVSDRSSGADHEVTGHVEVRWSHGRFGGLPEAKIYLDTPIERTPGYYALV